MLVADLLCGAGGSSTGAARALRALGLEMELVCLNHWPTAIETHTKNHPQARHYCQDISTVRPHIVVPEGYLDLLMASPSCTHHSVARGGKPTSDQQRSDPWHIITWLTELRVKRMIIENVWEFINWGPVDARTGKPIKSRKGEYFHAWIEVIRKLGFEPEWRKLNAADFGDATTRQRFILMARNDRKAVAWPVQTHAKRVEGSLELFPTLQPWRPAREIIDWNIRGKSIFGRPKPLAPKTLARIYAGAIKFGWPKIFLTLLEAEIERSLRYMINWSFSVRNRPAKRKDRDARRKLCRDMIARLRHFKLEPSEFSRGRGGHSAEPMLVTLRQNADGRALVHPIPALAASGQHIGLAEPVIVNGRKGNQAKGVSSEPVPTLDTKGGVWLAEPFVLAPGSTGAPRAVAEPLPTATTGGAGAEERKGCARPMLAEPFILNRHGDRTGSEGDARAHSLQEPSPTSDTRGGGFLVEPLVVTVAHGNDASERDPDSRRVKSIDNPLGAVHGTGSAYAVVEPFVLSRHGEGAPRSVNVDPTPTQVAKHSHILISPYYGSGSGETCTSGEEPLPSPTTKGRFGMVVPVTQTSGGPNARDVRSEPLPSMTTAKGGEFGLVVPVTHAGGEGRAIDPDQGPLPTVTGANRGELAFITAQHGERPGQAPRVHDLGQPTPTIAASGHVDLVEPTPEFDILFRMLEPHELAAAMGFNGDDAEYEFAGTKTEKIKQIGNAVSVRKMQACVAAIMADAAPHVSEKSTRQEKAVA